jgi:hypothetical protein
MNIFIILVLMTYKTDSLTKTKLVALESKVTKISTVTLFRYFK